jgi:hypothetical protein
MLKCKITISIKELKKIIKYNDGFTLGDLMNNTDDINLGGRK